MVETSALHERALAKKRAGQRLSFLEAAEVHFWETINSMRDVNGVVQKPELRAPPALTCEERGLNRKASCVATDRLQ